MHDQASELRELVRRGAASSPARSTKRPKLLLITGGQAGVGTTTTAVSLGLAFAGLRFAAVLVDADPRRGDAAVPPGAQAPHTLADVLRGRGTVWEANAPGLAGLRVLSAAQAAADLPGAACSDYEPLLKQLCDSGTLADFVVVDAGNGPTWTVQRFWQAADLILLVTTPQPAAVMDAYASVKLLGAAGGAVPILSLVNRSPSRSAARAVHARLAQACHRFLGINLGAAGYLPDDPRAGEAGEDGRALVAHALRSRFAGRARRVAKVLIRRAESRRSSVDSQERSAGWHEG